MEEEQQRKMSRGQASNLVTRRTTTQLQSCRSKAMDLSITMRASRATAPPSSMFRPQAHSIGTLNKTHELSTRTWDTNSLQMMRIRSNSHHRSSRVPKASPTASLRDSKCWFQKFSRRTSSSNSSSGVKISNRKIWNRMLVRKTRLVPSVAPW